MAGRADNDPALRVHRIGFLASRKRMVALATVSLSSISIEYSAGVWGHSFWRLRRHQNGYQQHITCVGNTEWSTFSCFIGASICQPNE